MKGEREMAENFIKPDLQIVTASREKFFMTGSFLALTACQQEQHVSWKCESSSSHEEQEAVLRLHDILYE